MQDLLAMTALQLASKENNQTSTTDDKSILLKIEEDLQSLSNDMEA